MFGIFGAITGFFAFIKSVAVTGMVGAAIGAASALLGRLFPGIGSLFVAAALGAIVMVGAFNSGYVHNSQADRIAQLEAEKAKLEHDMKATEEVYAKEQELSAAREQQIDDQQKVLDEVEKTIQAHADDKDCPGVFSDELDAIRKLK